MLHHPDATMKSICLVKYHVCRRSASIHSIVQIVVLRSRHKAFWTHILKNVLVYRVHNVLQMYDVGQSMGGIPSIFLRYNMDRYDAGAGKKQKSNEERLRDLVEAMEDIRANWMPVIEEGAHSMSVTWCKYMFYDHDFPEGIHKVEVPPG